MSLFKSETLGEKLDREAKEKEKIRRQVKLDKAKKEGDGFFWRIDDVSLENHSRVLIEQNECIIQLLSVLCSGQNAISGTAAIAVMNLYHKRLDSLKNIEEKISK